MTRKAPVALSLGVAGLLGLHAGSDREMLEEIRRGFPTHAFQRLETKLGVSRKELAGVLRIPERTLTRRDKSGKLPADESDRLYRLAHIYTFAVEVLGDEDSAARWLSHPNYALGNAVPLHMLDTEIGMRQVENVLGHIAFGDTFV